MRFMYIVTPAHPGPPTPELMEAMHKLADREIKAGRMLDSGGAGQGRGGGRGGRVHAAAQGLHAGLGRDVRGSRVCRPLRLQSAPDSRRP